MSKKKRALAIVAVLAAIAAFISIFGSKGASGSAEAATPIPVPVAGSSTIYTCVFNSKIPANRIMSQVYWSPTAYQLSGGCPTGDVPVAFNATGPKGPKGDTGAQGPSGVVSTGVHNLGAVAEVTTGGSFAAHATMVNTVDLKAGTYLLNLNAKAAPPAGGTGDVQVFPQFFVYNGAALPDWSNDLFNAGSGALEQGTHNNIDSYYSGSYEVTLASDTTLDVYAFGYDSDQGSGSYNLESSTLTATALTPAG